MSPAAAKIKRWKGDILAFVREEFKVTPDEWQADALVAFADPSKPRVSLQACAGPGKSAVMAWCAWWFLGTQGEVGEHPKGAAVSITEDNLRDGLWTELSKWQGRSAYLTHAFQWTKTRIFAKDHPETWWLSFRTWPKGANADELGKTLSGLHSKYIAAFIDESGAIPSAIARAAEQMLSTCAFGCIIQSGNPISLDGMLYAAGSTQRHLWHVIRITGDPDDPKRSPRIDVAWATQQIDTYGRDNPWVMSYILGRFPPASMNALLGVDEVEQAMRRHYADDAFDWSQRRIGIDAARFGDDPWVIFPRQGLVAFQPVEMRNPRTHDVVARVVTAKRRWLCDREYFDGTGGYSAGAIDGLLSAGYAPVEVQFSGKATDPRYYNKRAEMAFRLADWVKRGGALPPLGQTLVEEFTAITYSYKSGKFIVEEKEQIKRRIGRSPNLFDALSLTFAEDDMPRDTAMQLNSSGHAVTEFDPYAMVTA